MSKIAIIHHNDADGHTAAAVISEYHKERRGDLYFRECSYGETSEFKMDMIEPDTERVYIVDYSIDPNIALKLKNDMKVIWIDHHISAIEKYDKAGIHLDGLQSTSMSGCELAYLYTKGYRIFKSTSPTNEKQEFVHVADGGVWDIRRVRERILPKFVRLVGDFDTWTKFYRNESDHLVYGLKLFNTKPENFDFWDEIFSERGDECTDFIVKKGEVCFRFMKIQSKAAILCNGQASELKDFPGIKCIIANTFSNCGSFLFDEVFNDYHVGISYSVDKNGVTNYGIYRLGLEPDKEILVNKIAEKYGGGGHPGAAGFRRNNNDTSIFVQKSK